MWKDTISVVCAQNNYTLITYQKGGRQEWCVCLHYDETEKSWSSGTYCYSLETALLEFLVKFDNPRVKANYQSEIEDKYGIWNHRLIELATLFKDGLIEDDEESALEYFDEVCELTDKEKQFFGITE